MLKTVLRFHILIKETFFQLNSAQSDKKPDESVVVRILAVFGSLSRFDYRRML